MLGGDVFEMMGFVEHEAAVRREHRGLLPVVRRDAHRQIGREQVVIDDDDVRFRGAPPRGEHEAAIEVRALEARTQIGLGRDGVPDVIGRLFDQIGQAAVGGA